MHILSREGNIGIDEKILVRKDSYDAPDTLEHFHDFLEIVYIVSGNGAKGASSQSIPACSIRSFKIGRP